MHLNKTTFSPKPAHQPLIIYFPSLSPFVVSPYQKRWVLKLKHFFFSSFFFVKRKTPCTLLDLMVVFCTLLCFFLAPEIYKYGAELFALFMGKTDNRINPQPHSHNTNTTQLEQYPTLRNYSQSLFSKTQHNPAMRSTLKGTTHN